MKFDPYSPQCPCEVLDADGVVITRKIVSGDTETGEMVCLMEDEKGDFIIDPSEHNVQTETITAKPPLTLRPMVDCDAPLIVESPCSTT